MRRSLACLFGLFASHCAPTTTVARAYEGRVSIEMPTSAGAYQDAFQQAMLGRDPVSRTRARERWLRGEGTRPPLDDGADINAEYTGTREAIRWGIAAETEGRVFSLAKTHRGLAEKLAYERVLAGLPASILLRQMALEYVRRTGVTEIVTFVSFAGIPMATALHQLHCRDRELAARTAHELGLTLSDYDVPCASNPSK